MKTNAAINPWLFNILVLFFSIPGFAQKCPDSYSAFAPKGAKMTSCIGVGPVYQLSIEFPKKEPTAAAEGFSLKIQKTPNVEPATLQSMLAEYIQSAESDWEPSATSVQATQLSAPAAKELTNGKAWYIKGATPYLGALAPNELPPPPRVFYLCKYVLLHGNQFLFVDATAPSIQVADGWVANVLSKLK